MKDEKGDFDKFVKADQSLGEMRLNPSLYTQGDFDMELAKQISSVGWWSNRWTNMVKDEKED